MLRAAYLLFHLPTKTKLDTPADGLWLFLPHCLYVVELLHTMASLQFLFVQCHPETLKYTTRGFMHFRIQIERILVAIVLILFGGSITYGILSILDW